MLFEALGGSGVVLSEWKEFIQQKWYLAYKKIVYRKLICKRTPEMLGTFENFIKVSFYLFYKHSNRWESHTILRRSDCAAIRKSPRKKAEWLMKGRFLLRSAYRGTQLELELMKV